MNIDAHSIEAWQAFFDNRVRCNKDLVHGYLRYVSRLEERGLPPIFELRHLSEMIGVEERTLVQIVQRSSTFYRDFSIPKRLGGTREISVPSPVLLHAQRWINDEILSKLEVHNSAHGFVRGRSIVTNASVHLGNSELLKVDLTNFFPSIHFRRIMKVFLRVGYPVGVSYFLSSLCCRKKRLPQGAATSPALSNMVAKSMDVSISRFSDEAGLNYTRYADDLIISGEKIDRSTLDRVSWLVEEAGFSLNKKKTRILKGKCQKIVTGVSISNGKLALPRSSVREIKLEAYHILRSGYYSHAQATNNFDPILLERLVGRVGFWLQVDPSNLTAQTLLKGLTKYVARFDP